MLRKAKSPIALIMALILCISLFSGIVLAEGFADTSADAWNSIAGEVDEYDVVTPKENVFFVAPAEDAMWDDGAEFEYQHPYTGTVYKVVYGETLFGNIDAFKTYFTTYLETAEAGQDYTVVLADGSFANESFYPASDKLTGSTITVMGPMVGVKPFDEEGNVNPDRDIEYGYEAVLSGTMALELNKDFGIIFDGVALSETAKFTQVDYTGAATRFAVKLNNVYSIASGVAGTFNEDWTVATAGTDHVVFGFAGSTATTVLRDLTIENSYFEFERLANTSRLEDYTIKNSYFKGLADYSTFYNNIPLANPCLDGTYDKVATITFEGTRFENIANFWASGTAKGGTKSALLRTDLRDEQNATMVANNAKRGADGFVVTINNCDFIDMVPGDLNDKTFIRPQGFANGVMKVVFTNNTFAIKEGTTWAPVAAAAANLNQQALINPYAQNGTYGISYVIESNKFVGVTNPFSYNSAGDATNNAAYSADISKNYYVDLDGNLFTPSTNFGAVVTGQYVDEAMTEFTGDYLLADVGGATGLVANPVDITDAANGNYAGTATVDAVDAAAAVSASFAGTGITAGVFADADCENALTSFEGYKVGDVFYVKGVKGTTTILYTVTVADPYAMATGAEISAGVYDVADANTVFIDSAFAGKAAGDVIDAYTYVGNGKTYKLVYGTSAFATGEEVVSLISNKESTAKWKIVLAPGTYNLVLKCWAFNGTTVNVLGPQAGKTPINNPKKGYTGDAPWSVANNRSSDPATEAVVKLGAELIKNGTIIYDGIALKDFTFSRSSRSGNGSWSAFELRNVYWDQSAGAALLQITQNATDLHHRTFRFIDTMIDYSKAPKIARNDTRLEDLVFDGVYFVGNPDIEVENYNVSLFYMDTQLANNYPENGISELIVRDSRFEDIVYRGIFYTYQDEYCGVDQTVSATDSTKPYVARRAGSLAYIFENSDYVNIAPHANVEYPVVARIRTNEPDSLNLVFNNNYVYSPDAVDQLHKIIDLYNVGDSHTTMSFRSAVAKNNVIVGHNTPVVTHSSVGSRTLTNPVDCSYNYYEAADGTLQQPTAFAGTIVNGAYLDRDCTVHSSEVDVELAAELEGGVTTYPKASVSVILPMDKTFTAASLAAKEGATVTLYSDKALSSEIASVAPSATEIQTVYAKVAKNGYYVTYPVSIMPDVPDYTGEKIFYDPAVAGLADGTLVAREIDGENYLLEVGKNIASSATAAIFPEDEDGVTHVYFLAKEYAGFVISSGKYYFHGAKAGVNPNDAEDISKANDARSSDEGESIFASGELQIKNDGTTLTVDGFTFKGNAKFIPGSLSNEAGIATKVYLDIVNCRNSQEEGAYAAAPATAFIHGWPSDTKYMNLRNNRFEGQCFNGTSATAFSVIRNWHGVAENNYISMKGSKAIGNGNAIDTVFWTLGEATNQKNWTGGAMDITIQDNYLEGRVSSNINPAWYENFKVHVLDNTIIPLSNNKSLFTINASLSDGSTPKNYACNIATADIKIDGNDVINTNGAKYGFIWVAAELTTDEQKANMAAYVPGAIKVTNNNLDLTNAIYAFGMESGYEYENFIIDASGNFLNGVVSTVGVSPAIFNCNEAVSHFTLTAGDQVTNVNGQPVDTLDTEATFEVPASAIDTANKEITVAVDDKASAFNLLASNGAGIVVLDAEGNIVSRSATLAAADGVTEYRVAIAAHEGAYDEANVYTVKVVKGLTTVVLDTEKTVASKEDGKETWKTYWEANINVIGEFGTTIGTNDFKVTDYGMFYGNDEAELNKLAADNAYETAKAVKYSYAGENADGLEKVFKNYSFRFTGIAEGKYRYGKFYVTYELNGETITTVSNVQELYTGEIAAE